MSPDALRPHHERPKEEKERSQEQLRQRLAPGRQVVRGALDPLVPERHPQLERHLVLPLSLPAPAPASRRLCGAPAVQQDVQALLPRADDAAGLAAPALPGRRVAEVEDEVFRPGLVEQAGGGGVTAAPPAAASSALATACWCGESWPPSLQGVLCLMRIFLGEARLGTGAGLVLLTGVAVCLL